MAKAPVKLLTTSEFIQRYGNSMFTSEGIRRGLEMDSQVSQAHKLKAEEIDAIKQTNSKGFRIIDIDPNQLNRSDYMCSYTQEQILAFIGNDYAFEGGAFRYDNSGASTAGSTTIPYWRTINIPIAGNFLKIEILPARTIDNFIVPFDPTNPVSYVNVNSDPQNTSVQEIAVLNAAKTNILLDFETITSNPHIVKNGDIFETYFTNLYITVKQMNCRIRIIIGSNSKISSIYQKPVNLSLWDNGGFTRQETPHSSPFCFTDHQQNAIDFTGAQVASSTVYFSLIRNSPVFTGVASSSNAGVVVLFITDFGGYSYAKYGGDFVSVCDCQLVICEYNQSIDPHTPTSVVKVVASFSHTYRAIGVANGVGMSQSDQGNAISEPIRIVLQSGQGLFVRQMPVYKTAIQDIFVKYHVNGYMVGGFAPTIPFGYAVHRFTDHPFPMDNASAGFPNF